MIIAVFALALLIDISPQKPEWFKTQSIYVELPSIDYELYTEDDNGNELDTLTYSPIVSSFYGIAVDTKWAGFALSIQNPESEYELFEESKLFDLQFFGVFNKFEWELYYQKYEGLYISQEEEVSVGSRPAANARSYGFELRYFIKDDFDPKASFGSSQVQREANGSWILGLYGNRQTLKANSGLIPTEFESNFDQLAGLREFETSSLGVDAGYGGMYLGDWYYLTGFFTLGFQMQEQTFKGIAQEDRIVSGASNNLHLEFGYPFKNGAAGIRAKSSNLEIPIKNAKFSQSRNQVRIFYKHYY